jgi:hypothetical protein
VMEPGLGELMDTLKAQGIASTGPWFTHHLKMDPEIFDFEIGLPVSASSVQRAATEHLIPLMSVAECSKVCPEDRR